MSGELFRRGSVQIDRWQGSGAMEAVLTAPLLGLHICGNGSCGREG